MAITSPRASARSKATFVPLDYPDEQQHRYLLGLAVRQLQEGKILATGTVTLTASAGTTTLNDVRIGPDSVILFMPETANAAADLTGLYVTGRIDGQATINHPNNANADKTYGYAILG